MVILSDDVVLLREAEKEGDPTVITVNCPDKLGLGSDICRILLHFGLNITRADESTDGHWCYIVFWVTSKTPTRWSLVKKRLIAVCPSCTSVSGISYYWASQPAKPPNVFLLKLCCHDRRGLLHDVTVVLCDLELVIKRVKVSTTPDGRVMDLFFITDTRELLHTKKRQEDTKECLNAISGDNKMISCEIEMVGPEITACSQNLSFLPSEITDEEESLSSELPDKCCPSKSSSTSTDYPISVEMDNTLSPSHTLVQVSCRDHKGLLYDIMRTFKDYNVQICYGRGAANKSGRTEIDLFIMQSDGKKIVDQNKQNALRSRLMKEVSQPLRVAVVSKGPDTELLVANPVELSGKGRPLVFHDITLALKTLDICIFTADIGRHIIGHREWEVYRVLLHEGDCLFIPRNKIEAEVRKMLMGWN